MGKPLTEEEKRIVIRWIVENVSSAVVPADEGNSDALIWNMVRLAELGPDVFSRSRHIHCYLYLQEQDAEVERWRAGDLPI